MRDAAKKTGWAILVAAALGWQPLASTTATAAEPARRIEFNRDIRPILSDNCFHCHGPDKNHREGELRLDHRDDAVTKEAIVPGKPEKSLLVERLYSKDPTELMPPAKAHKVLTEAQKSLLVEWIRQGAEYQPHWAYVPPVRAAVPQLRDASLVRSPIDAFIQQPLEALGVKPSPEADRRTLIRRLSLDLLGLPPTPQQVQEFLADASPNAYEKLVDRLLASPHYGERMAQGWLDLARYADTVGFHGDQNQNAWAYRDYVVDAFNANKPFDQFTIEQLAGDLLPNPTPEQLTASCFNRLNMMTREGGAQPKEYLAKYTADRIRTVGTTWLGSTLACAECHDHKFDPFTMKDFYSLGAFFADVKQWGVYADYAYTPNPDLRGVSNDSPFPPEIIVQSKALQARMDRLESQMLSLAGEAAIASDKLSAWRGEMREFLASNATGWETPASPAVRLSAATPADPKAKPSKPAAKPAAKQPASQEKKAEPAPSEPKPDDAVPAKPQYTVDSQGWITIANKTVNVDVDLQPAGGSLASLKLDLKGDSQRSTPAVVRVSLSLHRQGEKPRPLMVRYAHADEFDPVYRNGFANLGVHKEWKLTAEHLRSPRFAVYLLDKPVTLKAGDVIRVRLADYAAGDFRVSSSPLVPDLRTWDFASVQKTLEFTSKEIQPAVRLAYLYATAADDAAFQALLKLEAEHRECRGGKTPVMVTEAAKKPLVIRVLARGNWMDESGAICSPVPPAFLSQSDAKQPVSNSQPAKPQNRLDLARWLCSKENPLTARVVMNRLWRQFFGNGISAQVDDLGAQGEPPSHPELLDFLALDFQEHDWDIKRAVKQIVMSHTYRQQSHLRAEMQERDPANRLLASQNPRRLEAEFIRDNALAVSGLLNPEMGGPPSKPYQPEGYYAAIQFPDRTYAADKDERQYRRGVYMHWQRTFLHPMLANFDAPSREDCIAIRTSANSPQQAMTLLNDPSFVEAARVWAVSLMRLPGDDAARIRAAFEQALARQPLPSELSSLQAFLGKARAEYQARPEDASKLLAVGLSPVAKGVDPVEAAAWTSLCRVILNLHETITRY